MKEKAMMREDLLRAQAEREDAIALAQDWQVKFENFTTSVANEKENLVWLHNRHTRLISSRSIYLQLERFILKKQNTSMSQIKWFKQFRDGKSKSTFRLWHVFNRYADNRIAYSFRKWCGVLNWKATAKSRNNFADAYYHRITLSKCFADWRQDVTTALRIRSKRDLALRTLYKLMGTWMQGTVQGRFTLWANKINFFNNREVTLGGLIFRKYNRTLRRGMAMFQRATEMSQQEQCREDLATELAGLHFKHAVFSALKNTTFRNQVKRVCYDLNEQHSDKLYQMNIEHEMQQSLAHTSARTNQVGRVLRIFASKDTANAFYLWRSEKNEYSQLQNWVTKFRRDAAENSWGWVERTFNAWRHYKTKAKFEAAATELGIEKPKRIEMEMGLSREQNAHLRSQQKAACRVATKMFGGNLKSFYQKWAESVFHFKYNQVRVKNMIMHNYFLLLKSALGKWKTTVSEDNYSTITDAKRQVDSENESLNSHVFSLESDIACRKEERSQFKSKRIDRAMNRFHFLIKRRALRLWGREALSRANKIAATVRIEAELKQRILYNALNKVLANKHAKLRKQGNRFRMTKFILSKNKELMNFLYAEWVHFVKCRKRFRKCIDMYNKTYTKHQLAKGWNTWIVHGRDASRLKQAHDNISQLETVNDNLEDSLSRTSQSLATMTKQHKHASKQLSHRAKLRVANQFARLSSDNKARLLHKWRQNTIHCNRETRYMSRMQLLWNIQISRKAFRTWSQVANKIIQAEADETINGHVHDKKEMRRDAAAVKAGLEKEVSDRDELITSQFAEIGKLNTRQQRMLCKSVATASTDYSENKAAYVFKMWAARHRCVKRSLRKVMKTTLSSVLKVAILNIKSAAAQEFKVNRIRCILIGAFKRYSRRGLKNLFYTWKRSAVKRTNTLYEEEIQLQSTENAKLNLHKRDICRNSRQKAYNVLTRNTKSGIFQAWIALNLQLKRIRYAKNCAESKLATMKLKSGLDILVKERQNKQLKNHKINLAEVTYCRSIMSHALNSWHFIKERNKYMQGILGMQDNRYVLVSMVTAFNFIKGFADNNRVNANRLSEQQTKALSKTVSRLPVLLQRRFFSKWKSQAVVKLFSLHSKKQVLLRALHAKLRVAWKLWQENEVIGDVMRDAETCGPVAVENNSLKNRVDILEGLIEKEGIDPKYVEEYILEHETIKDAMMRKSIARLSYNAKQSITKVDSTNTLPRAFLSWKMFLLKKKRVLRSAIRCWARMRKPAIFQAFREWKQGLPLVANTVGKLTRQQIYGLVAKMDSDIKAMENVVEDQAGQLSYLQHYATLLENHTRRGQNQALAFCRQNTEKSMTKSWARWLQWVNGCRMADVASDYSNLEDDYYLTRTKLAQLSEDNGVLVTENAELRQASLDGIAIADAIEELSKEREKLSVDLADRAATIKRLLEENTELNYKIKTLTRGSLIAPERDHSPNYESSRLTRQ